MRSMLACAAACWVSLYAATARTQALGSARAVAAAPGANVTVGGQLRLRYELLDPSQLGVTTKASTRSVLLSRNLLSVDARLSPSLGVFGQLGGHYVLGAREPAQPPDANELDVTQLFVDAVARLGAVQLRSRFGRQEMPLGSARWFGLRDGTNLRQTYDLARVTLTRVHADTLQIDAFLGSVPRLQRGVFDDAPTTHERLWGVYATLALLPDKLWSIDTFYVGRVRPHVRYSELAGREARHTFAVRLFGETAWGLQYIEHALLQVGSLDSARVVAWAFASALWQRLPEPFAALRIGIRSEALSGDSRPGDGTLTTFQPLFASQGFYGGLPAIYPTNLYELHPMFRFQHGPLSLDGGCVFFWRQAVEDAIYRPPGIPTPSASSSHSRYTGTQLSLAIGYVANAHLSFNADYSRLVAGPGLSAAGGRTVNFFAAWMTYDF